MLPERVLFGDIIPVGIDWRCRWTAARGRGGAAFRGATGDEERPTDERLRRTRGRSALMVIASVWASSDGSTLLVAGVVGTEKLDAVGVVSSAKVLLKARGVVGSGVRGRWTPSESTARRPELKKDE